MAVPEPLKLAAFFIVHIATGLVLFAVIAAAAGLVSYVGRMLGTEQVPYYVLTAFDALGLFLFAADFICVIVFIGIQTALFVKDLVKYLRKAWQEE